MIYLLELTIVVMVSVKMIQMAQADAKLRKIRRKYAGGKPLEDLQ